MSGQTGWDMSTGRLETDVFEEQMITSLNNLKFAMEEAGSSLENIVKTHMLLPNAANYASKRGIELDYYHKYAPKLVDEPPASTCIHPLNLYAPNCLVELDAIGFVPDR
jgi:enamine deaminase RidA (YjgF/YER057c/UK114 family)